MPMNGVVIPSRVMVLTDSLDSTGVLHWHPPAGYWSVYRFGHTTTGALVQPAQPQVAGLECDKMSAEAVGFHMDRIIADLQHNLGRQLGKTFTHVNFDSYEAGDPSWTPKMPEEFLARRGYNLLSYLPVFAGRTVESDRSTWRFQADFDRTIQDLYRDHYFKVISQKLQQAGLGFMCEPYGGPLQIDEVAPYVHMGTAEFWTTDHRFTPYATGETIKAFQKAGKNIIEAEAFTGKPAFSKWDEYPAQLKPIGDEAFCAGINKLMLHRYVHQPWADKYRLGNTMGQWGTHFDRTQTWWKPAKAMVQYWQRCQALLQWGHHVEKSVVDFSTARATPGLRIDYQHRQQGATHVYFVANLEQQAGAAECSFEVSGSQPELWNPVTGEIDSKPAFRESNGRTMLTIPFAAGQSYFIVFRKKREVSGAVVTQKPVVISTLQNPWKVTFDSKWGGPDTAITFRQLTDWSASLLKEIKYYSGTAVYTTTFAAPATEANRNLYLHLGKVNHIASVVVNGIDLGVVWTAPWQVKLPPGILRSSNTLQIAVTNEWANRLIGDEQEPQDATWGNSQYSYPSGQYLKAFPEWFLKGTKRSSSGRYCFTTWNYFNKDSSLLPSGLIGPVRLLTEHWP